MRVWKSAQHLPQAPPSYQRRRMHTAQEFPLHPRCRICQGQVLGLASLLALQPSSNILSAQTCNPQAWLCPHKLGTRRLHQLPLKQVSQPGLICFREIPQEKFYQQVCVSAPLPCLLAAESVHVLASCCCCLAVTCTVLRHCVILTQQVNMCGVHTRSKQRLHIGYHRRQVVRRRFWPSPMCLQHSPYQRSPLQCKLILVQVDAGARIEARLAGT